MAHSLSGNDKWEALICEPLSRQVDGILQHCGTVGIPRSENLKLSSDNKDKITYNGIMEVIITLEQKNLIVPD